MTMIRGRALKSSGPTPPSLVSFTTGTDAEIAAMVNAYYDGIFSLQDIQSVWSVGDTREISLPAIASVDGMESHVAQPMIIQILDFNHDTLTTPEGEITKALVTVDFKTIFYNENTYTAEGGIINDTAVNNYKTCKRRTWLNDTFYNSLPNYLKTNVKEVNKYTNAGNKQSTIETTSDKCFLLSEIELFNTTQYSFSGEGSIYSLYSNNANARFKYRYQDAINPDHSGSSYAYNYTLRSPYKTMTKNYEKYTTIGGGIDFTSPTGDNIIAPAFCL